MSLLDRLKNKKDKLQRRIDVLNCNIVMEKQIILAKSNATHAYMVWCPPSDVTKQLTLTEMRDGITESEANIVEFIKKVEKKTKLLAHVDEYIKLLYKQLEINEYKTKDFGEQLLTQHFGASITDRLMELEQKIDKPKWFQV